MPSKTCPSGVALANIHLTRGKPRQNKPDDHEMYPGASLKRLPSNLPSPGAMKLSLCLGKKIGYGAGGRVYEAMVEYDHSSPGLRHMAMPPLVVTALRQFERCIDLLTPTHAKVKQDIGLDLCIIFLELRVGVPCV
ncbi:hypothetical protein QCA50_004041 [Cerrena zonata]|uniref:Uncharacterized protein n=1 Tax=Cerrena zonata TaxID=2478898 RepID=A0AAW0GS93_9APHY